MLNIQIGALPGPFFSVPKPHIIRQTPHDFLERFQREKNDYYASKLLSFFVLHIFILRIKISSLLNPWALTGPLLPSNELIWVT